MIRDDVQFVRKHKYPDGSVGKSYQVHAPIKCADGVKFLTVPVKHDGRQTLAKTDVTYETAWVDDHISTIMYAYRKSPNFENLHQELTELLHAGYRTIAELNTATILWGILRLLGEQQVTRDKLTIPFVESKLREQSFFRLKQFKKESETETAKYPDIRKNERIIALCKEVGATEDYCGGTATAAYVDHTQFEENGITITIQDWKCQEYNQQFAKQGFIGNLSIIDLLMNVPQKRAMEIMQDKQTSVTHTSTPLIYSTPVFEPEAMVILTDMMGVLPRGILVL